MATTAKRPGPDPVALGRAALGERRWKAARDHFAAAVASSETPEGYEGLSWALWWLDDADAVVAARERAHRLYRRRRDAAGAARTATWLACDHLDFHGARAVASGWLARAGRLLAPLDPVPEHGWLAFLQGYIARAEGDAERAIALARDTTGLGERLGVADLLMLGLALEGSTLVACGQVADGARRLDEATTIALQDEAEVPIAGAWACCFLVTACAAVRDYERAYEWCDRIAEFAQRYGSRYMLAFCRAEYGGVDVARGRWARAETALQGSIADFTHSRPPMVGGPLAALAELRRRQGRADEAALLLERAGASRAAQLCRARLALDAGDGARAIELAERVLRQLAPGIELDRFPALELLVEARAARGELAQAGAALERLRSIARAAGTAALSAAVDLAAGLVAAGAAEHGRARALLEDAVDRLDRCGAPFEAARARIALATTLAALDRHADARREAAAARERLAELGAIAEAERAGAVLGAPLPQLTPREREVLALVAEGLSNRQIASALVVSEHTVHRHVSSILRKLGVPTRAAAAAAAARAGLPA
jgi:ATP/maltotriose-dependent transcriptional regulator MalT